MKNSWYKPGKQGGWSLYMSDLLTCFSVWARRKLSVLTSYSDNVSGTSPVPLLLLAIKSSGGGGAVDVLDKVMTSR